MNPNRNADVPIGINPPQQLRRNPVAVFATTLGSGFIEMILHPLLIQNPKFKISPSFTSHSPPVTRHSGYAANPKSASMLPDNRHFDFC
jgi:hypothetical protein